jgi:hypothetical protein
MIHSVLYGDIALDDLQTTVHHDTRWWIDRCECLPELASRAIVTCTIESKCLSIGEVRCPICHIFTISDEFIDTDACGFSFYSYGIEFSGEKVGSEKYLCRLWDDDMDVILLAHPLQTGCDVHRITEDGIVEPIMGTNIAHHHLT